MLNDLRVKPGRTLAIFGVGALGLSAVLAARLAGAGRIIAIDRHKGRLDLARQLGAHDVILGGAEPLPAQIKSLRARLYGLTIRPARLQQIRNERRPGSKYATLANCEFEIREAEALMRQEGIPYLDATSKSVEELATTILQEAKLERRIY